ncbi:unnamed protein product, partial [Tetraodon nigroviridis]
QLTVYLGRRDFVDHVSCVDPVDGIVLVEPEYLKDRKVFVTLNCAFRYGQEDLDVLGLSFRKDLFAKTIEVFPPAEKDQKPLSQFAEQTVDQAGSKCIPLYLHRPQDSGKACGVDYELQAFCAKSADEKIHHRNSVHLVIRKVQFAPETPGPQPIACSFLVPVRQYADICLFSMAQYKCQVAHLEADDQISPSSTSCHIYTLTPLLRNNREKRGLALDGKLKHEDTNLASSTIIKEGASKEMMGILVSYRVKVKLVVSLGGYVK